MRTRRRSKDGLPTRKLAVLSTPPAEALAPSHGPPPRKRRRAKCGVETVQASDGGHPSTGDVLNAFWQRTDLTLVLPDTSKPTGVRYQRIKAEHSCFVRRQDLDNPAAFVRLLNHHSAVRKTTWEGDWLRIVWTNRDMLRHYCRVLESDVQQDGKTAKTPIPTYEGMVSPVLRHMVDRGLRPAAPRQIWIDIETDSRVPFSKAREGEARILCWVAIDAEGRTYKGLLEEDTDEAEERLMVQLWAVLDRYDQVMAWSGDRFDFPVIKARSERYKLLRPSLRDWRRWLWLDHLDLYRRMNMAAAESGDEKQSMALDAVANSVLGTGKHDFDASQTWEAWEAGGARRQELLDYCEQDTRLMPQIEDKTGFVMLLQTVADTCGTFADSRGSNPGVQVEGFLARLAHEQGHKFPTVLKAKVGDQYEGAFVLHPDRNAGVHRGVHVADFASLYPTIICTWNMSPETIVENAVPFGQYVPGAAYSPLTDQHFKTDRQGILPLAVTQLMELRRSWNERKAALPPGTAAWKDADRRSAAYKITANSFYGVIGAPTSRHYDRRVAESVTQCGKWLIQRTIEAAHRRGMRVIYGDTDSLFVAGAERAEFEQFVQWCNTDLYPELLQGLGCTENRIKLAYEKQFDRLIFTTAKRYVGNYVHYKGTDADVTSKPEIKGLEFKRGDSIRLTRRFQEQVTYMLVGYQVDTDPDDVEAFEAVCEEWLHHVLHQEFELDDVLMSKRLNKPLDEYKAESPMVRIAREMEERGEDVGEGAKIAYVVVDAYESPQLVAPVREWHPDMEINRMAMWDKHVWPPTQRLLEAAFPDYSWGRFTGLIKAARAEARAKAKAERDAARERDKQARAAVREAKRREREALKARKKAAPPRKKRHPRAATG